MTAAKLEALAAVASLAASAYYRRPAPRDAFSRAYVAWAAYDAAACVLAGDVRGARGHAQRAASGVAVLKALAGV